MSIPELRDDGLLPEGIHATSLDEIRERYGFTLRRRNLLEGLDRAVKNLADAGVKVVFLDGSFVTNKQQPGDIDGCWEANDDIDESVLDPVFLDFDDSCSAMKMRYGVHFFIAQRIEGSSGVPFVDFFKTTADGTVKGILRIELGKESQHD